MKFSFSDFSRFFEARIERVSDEFCHFSAKQAPNGASRSLEAPRKGLGSSAMQQFKLHSRKPWGAAGKRRLYVSVDDESCCWSKAWNNTEQQVWQRMASSHIKYY